MAASRRKTSVYLEPEQVRRLTDLAEHLGRSQAEIIRDAIARYDPTSEGDRNFALARGFRRIDSDPRPTSESPPAELTDGFGARRRPAPR
ncbi:MAG: CopG family transcriptional regulator, partial [Actinobacteria bacterium]|nr:CopG family transcriptional regulator [Actinomycetota bacterium]